MEIVKSPSQSQNPELHPKTAEQLVPKQSTGSSNIARRQLPEHSATSSICKVIVFRPKEAVQVFRGTMKRVQIIPNEEICPEVLVAARVGKEQTLSKNILAKVFYFYI